MFSSRSICVSKCLTEPELSAQVPEPFGVILPAPEEIHWSVFPPLENLQTGRVRAAFTQTRIRQTADSVSSYHPASAVRLHVAVNHDGRPLFAPREDLHLSWRPDAVLQLLSAVCGEGEPQRTWRRGGQEVNPHSVREHGVSLWRERRLPVVNSVETALENRPPSSACSCTVYVEPGWSLVRLSWVTEASTITSCWGTNRKWTKGVDLIFWVSHILHFRIDQDSWKNLQSVKPWETIVTFICWSSFW